MTPWRSHEVSFQRAWLRSLFSDWLREIPAETIIGIAGNHDFVAQEEPETMRSLPWTYLEDESVNIGGLKIHGSPWSNQFFDWAFMAEEDELEEKWALIPDDTHVLLTHGPPHGYGDMTARRVRAGSRTLRYHLDYRLTKLRLHVFGHIHEDFGLWQKGDLTLANGSYVDLKYRPRPFASLPTIFTEEAS